MMPNFTWPQVAVIGIGLVALVFFFGFLTDSIQIHIGRRR